MSLPGVGWVNASFWFGLIVGVVWAAVAYMAVANPELLSSLLPKAISETVSNLLGQGSDQEFDFE